MPASIAYPSNSVANGATVIQTSAFNVAAGDYMPLNHTQALTLLKQRGKAAGFPGAGDKSVTLIVARADLPADQSHLANVIVVRANPISVGHTPYSETTGSQNVLIHKTRVEILHFFAVQITKSDGAVITDSDYSTLMHPVYTNPETGGRFSENDAYNIVMESMGFLFTQVAASFPSMSPALKAAAGVTPLT
jgi:hypothetical protein